MDKILSLTPRDADEIFWLARVTERVDKEKGIEYWKKYIEITDKYPMNPEKIAHAKKKIVQTFGTSQLKPLIISFF
jgi:hypothetical protein